MTEADITQTIAELQSEIDSINNIMDDPDERLERFARNSLPKRVRELELFTSHTPTEILETVWDIYKKAANSERTGLRKQSVIIQIRSEFPNVLDYYRLLQKKTWGYNLGQAVITALEAEELKKSHVIESAHE
ncbi:MAG: hypothetical protein AAB899_02830 [Patescibacteria group bacterium]